MDKKTVLTNIALVGEAWGEAEAKLRMPFVGPAGYELNGQLEDAGINRRECFITNVFNLKPEPSNDIKNLCCSKREETLGWPPITAGNYLREEYASEIARLSEEILQLKPNIIVALGGTALWALTGSGGISKNRGALCYTNFLGRASKQEEILHRIKVLPTFHPAAIMRQYELRPIAVADLMKAKRQSTFPEIRWPKRLIYIPESIKDLWEFYNDIILSRIYSLPYTEGLSTDIETANDQLTCIGFAPSPYLALVVPFWDASRGGNYWSTSNSECEAWRFVRCVLTSDVPKIFQNGLYDIHWLWKRYGIPVKNAAEDTMLLHHALHPEAQKGLGFLGSIYTDAPAWKTDRLRSTKTGKKED